MAKPTAKNRSNELKLIRTYDAPVEVVWNAWTDPNQAAQWWGPRGFTITTHSKELRPGGIWHYTMHGPDGVDYPNKTHYLEIETHSRLVYDHGGYDDRPPLFRVTVVFSESKGKTTMDMTMALATPEAAEEIALHIKKMSGDSTWDRLGEYLAKIEKNKEQFIINRSFNAPIATMFDMWTNPKLLLKWMGPAEASMEFFRADIEAGGSTFYTMSGPNGYQLFGKAHYIEITKPHRLIYTQQFCDKNEKTCRHPMAPVWPESMLTLVEFTEEGPHQTRVTVTWETDGPCTPEEVQAFIAARTGMTQGWTGSFDKLEDLCE